jgi:hypothetical protein
LTIDYIEKVGITDSKDSLAAAEEDFEALGLVSAGTGSQAKDQEISGDSPIVNIIRSVQSAVQSAGTNKTQTAGTDRTQTDNVLTVN